MKSLKTLVKLEKRKIDKIVLDIDLLKEEKKKQEESIQKLDIELKEETEKFSDYIEFAFMMEKYKERIKQEKTTIKQKILNIEKKLIDLGLELKLVFNSLKKFEHVLSNKIKEENIKAEKKEELEVSDNIIMKHNWNK